MAYDPRYLVFEFVHNLMLRSSQIGLVEDFMKSILDPTQGAAVHQLIMGSGKTTVVAPLLALMLPDTKPTTDHMYNANANSSTKTIVVQVCLKVVDAVKVILMVKLGRSSCSTGIF